LAMYGFAFSPRLFRFLTCNPDPFCRRKRVKKITTLLLLIGLVCAPASLAGTTEVAQAISDSARPASVTKPTESVAPEPEPAVPQALSEQAALKKTKAGDDFVTLNFTNIEISALVKVMSEL